VRREAVHWVSFNFLLTFLPSLTFSKSGFKTDMSTSTTHPVWALRRTRNGSPNTST